jgi:hypothetical protein
MSTDSNNRPDNPTGSDRLILDAYERAADHRERAELAPFVPDRVVNSEIATAEYFASVIEYYSRLEPHLPDRPHYWEKVALVPHPIGSDRNMVAEAVMDYYNLDAQTALDVLDQLENDPEYPVGSTDDTMRGLRSLQAWRSRTTTKPNVYNDVLEGRVVTTRELPQYLPRKHTLRVHTVLDQAASDLGFGPEGEIPEEWDKDPI